jgi:hypothetical protein
MARVLACDQLHEPIVSKRVATFFAAQWSAGQRPEPEWILMQVTPPRPFTLPGCGGGWIDFVPES